MLTRKICTMRRLTCRPNLVEEHHSAEGFSLKHLVDASPVGSTSSFGRRVVPRLKEKSIRECVMTWIEYKEGDELMTGTRWT
jgi:hypothetical protein